MSAWLISLNTHNICKFHSCRSMYQNLILGLGILVKKQLIIDIDLLMDSQFYYTDDYVYCKSVPYSIDHCCFLLSFEIKKARSSNFVLCQDYFGYFGLLAFPNEYLNHLVNFCKKPDGILRGIM